MDTVRELIYFHSIGSFNKVSGHYSAAVAGMFGNILKTLVHIFNSHDLRRVQE